VAFNDTHKEKVRLIGVEAPEIVHRQKSNQQFAREALSFTKSALQGKKIWLNMDTQLRDKNRQLLGYIWTEKPSNGESDREIRSKMFNASLLLEGYAQVADNHPKSKYADAFDRYQYQARRENKGFWGRDHKRR
jgi:micrococcal nuclease